MSGLLPFRTEAPQSAYDEPVVVDLTGEEADEVFTALSSATARRTLAALYEEPQTASDLADSLDLSLQNVNYHVKNLLETELIEVVDIWYSETGNEMKVYAPTTAAVMILSDESTIDRVRGMLRRAFTAIAFLGIVTLFYRGMLVEYLAPELGNDPGTETTGASGDNDFNIDDSSEADGSFAGGDDGREFVDLIPTSDPLTDLSPDVSTNESTDDTDTAQSPNESGSNDAESLPIAESTDVLETLPTLLDPGVAFFLGGLSVVVVMATLWWYKER